MLTLAAVLIVKNEQTVIHRCITSLIGKVDKILITDTGSTDDTLAIVKQLQSQSPANLITVSHYDWQNDFSKARNYALAQSDSDYNLVIDADEYLVGFDRPTTEQLLSQNSVLGQIKIVNLVDGDQTIHHQTDILTRVLPRDCRYIGAIHEQVDSKQQRVLLPITIEHDGYYQRKPEKFQRNIQLLEQELTKKPDDSYLLYQLAHEYSGLNQHQTADLYYQKCHLLIQPTQPYYVDFILNYLKHCIDFSHFDTGLYLIDQSERHMTNNTDFYFMCGSFYLELVLSNAEKYIDYLPLIEQCYLACLEIGSASVAKEIGTASYLAAYNLASFYQVSGQTEKARHYYQMADDLGYAPAKKQLQTR